MLTSLAALLPSIGLPEVLIILLIVVVLFGARKLPELGKGIGEGIRSFKKGIRDAADDNGSDSSSPGGQDRPS